MAEQEGKKYLDALRFGGRTEDQVNAFKSQMSSALLKGGRTQEQVGQFFGDVPVDDSDIKDYAKTNLDKYKESKKDAEGNIKPESKAVTEIDSFTDAYHAILSGAEASVSGLVINKENPEHYLSEDASLPATILSASAQLVGDAPAIFAGIVGGGAVAGPIGAGAGSFAAPQAMRKLLMDHYEKGDINSPRELLARLSAASWEGIKGGVVGAATAGTGRYLQGIGTKAIPRLLGELGVMTGTSSALEGHLPTVNSVAANAVLLAGVHGLTNKVVPRNIQKTYVETGLKPEEQVKQAETDIVFRQKLITEPPPEIPKTMEPVEINSELSMTKPKALDPIPAKEIELRNEAIPRTEAEMEAAAHIGKSEIQKNDLPLNDYLNRAVDDLHPFKEMEKDIAQGKPITPEESIYTEAQLFRQMKGKIDGFIYDGTIDFKTGGLKEGGISFKAALSEIPTVKVGRKTLSDIDGFELYGMAKTTVERAGRTIEVNGVTKKGIETGLALETAKTIVKEGSRFEKAFRAFNKAKDGVVDYYVDSGVFSKEQGKLVKQMNRDHFNMSKVQEYDPIKGSAKRPNPMARATGSDKQVLPPLDTAFRNLVAMVRAAELNKLSKKIITTAEKNSEISSKYIRKVENQVKKINVLKEEVLKSLEGVEGAEFLTKEDINALSVFRAKEIFERDNIMRVGDDGHFTYYEVNPDIAKTLKALNSTTLDIDGFLWKALKLNGDILRFGVTENPAFSLGTNFLRDAGSAWIHEGVTPIDAIKAVKDLLKNSDVAVDAKIKGALSSSYKNVAEILDMNLGELNNKTGFADAAWNVVKHPLTSYQKIPLAVENSFRLAAFKKRGGGIAGAKAGRNVTVDFNLGTDITRSYNQITPFFGPKVQGIKRSFEAFNKENRQRTLIYGSALSAIAIANWVRNKDRSEYTTAADWEKNTFMIVPGMDNWVPAYNVQDAKNRPVDMRRKNPDTGVWEVNDPIVFKYPKPPTYGAIFMSFYERLLDGIYDSHGRTSPTGQSLMDGLAEALIPSEQISDYLPIGVKPRLEQTSGYVFFTNQQLIPKGLEKVAPQLQYKEYTSETARQLGKIIGAVPWLRDIGPEGRKLESPLVIENYIRSWTGGLGKLAVNIADAGLHAAGIGDNLDVEKPADTLSDIFYVQAFVLRNPTMNSNVINTFYENYNRFEIQYNSSKKMYKDAEQIKDPIKRTERMKEAITLFNEYSSLYKFSKGLKDSVLTTHNKMIRQIYSDDKLNKDDKRQLIEGLYWKMIESARYGNLKFNQIESQKR